MPGRRPQALVSKCSETFGRRNWKRDPGPTVSANRRRARLWYVDREVPRLPIRVATPELSKPRPHVPGLSGLDPGCGPKLAERRICDPIAILKRRRHQPRSGCSISSFDANILPPLAHASILDRDAQQLPHTAGAVATDLGQRTDYGLTRLRVPPKALTPLPLPTDCMAV
jgi:hypothetical protein